MPSVNIIEERIAVAGKREGVAGIVEVLLKQGKSSSRKKPLATLFSRARALREGDFSPCVNKSAYFSFVAACMIFAVLFFLLPGVSTAARIAGDEHPVTTAPASAAIAPQKTVVEKKAAATTEKSATGAGAAAVAAPPAKAAESAAVPRTPATAIPAPAGPVQPTANAGSAPVVQPAFPPQTPPAAGSGRYVTIDFDNVDISVFIKFVSELTGRNFVVDDKVKGKVTVISPRKIAVDEVYKVFESVLEIYGFATVQAGEVIKVIPALEARGKNLELRLKKDAVLPEDRIVTQILSLQHATPDDMKKVLDPLVSKTSVVLSYPPAGMLIITDVLSNIKRLQDIVTALDVEGVGEMISYIPLKYASAAEMAKSLTLIFQKQAVPGRAGISPVKVVADDRTNALIILAAESDMTRIRELLNLMDKEVPRGSGTIRVYYLQNAKAEDLVKVLTGLPQQTKAAGAAGTPAAASAPGAVFSKNISIMADKSTNALIVTADPADYAIIEDVIQKLDITRPMVYLEGLIMEVNANKSFNVGVEWSMLRNVNIQPVTDLGGKSAGMVGFTGAGLIPQVSSTGAISMPSGFSMGIVGAGITIGGVLFPNIGAVLNAYQNDADVRILSTPQLLTLDNEEAEITVGENVPYVSRQDSGVVGSTTN
ncbi:MAG: type II secretion system secretin GspD, partial [Syntrophales bacterium]